MASKRLTKAVVERAVADAAAGQTYNLNDAACPGLELRVAPRGATFSLRTSHMRREVRLRLAGVDLLTLDQARSIASDGMLMLRERRIIPDANWLRIKLQAIGVLAKPVEAPLPAPKPSTWTFSQAAEHYLSEVKRTRREATWRDRRGMLGMPELKPLAQRPVGAITRQEIAAIVGAIHRSGRERHAAHLCEVIRPMWSWLAEDGQQLRSGVLGREMSLLRPPEKTNREGQEATTHLPPVDELGRLLALIRAGVVDETFSDALMLLLYTVQRRRAVASARIADFVEEEDGSLTWQLPPLHRKTGRGKSRTHDLPLPDAVAAMVRRRIEAASKAKDESPWLFPALRPRKTGDATAHIHADSLTHLLADLPGIVASPHDLRRGFATHLEEIAGIPLATLKIVLDHSEGHAPGDVTDVHYSRARRLKPKAAILAEWTTLIETAAAKVVLGDVDGIKKSITAARTARANAGKKKGRPEAA